MHEQFLVFQCSLDKWIVLLQIRIQALDRHIEGLNRNPQNLPETFYKLKSEITMKGCCRFPSIVFSLMTWSTYLSLMISAFLRLFRATYLLVILFLARRTLPKDPNEIELVYIINHLFLEFGISHNLIV